MLVGIPNAFGSNSNIQNVKRYGNLKYAILNDDNIIEAEHNARKGKAKTYGVKRFDSREDLSLEKIKQSLKNLSYRTSNYHVFKIYEPKERNIFQLPYYPDRIVHHVLLNVLEPIFVKWFIHNTYSCIKGRGIHKMQQDLERDLRKHPNDTKWCLKLDIRKFYPSIDIELLISTLKTKIKDQWVIAILSEIIRSVDNGVPIGNYLSQFFANIYLNKIDHWVKETLRVQFYYRYCDDIVILGDDKKELYKFYRQIKQRLSFIKLTLKTPRLFLVDCGIDFAGYVFRHSYTLIRKRMKIRFKRKVAKYKNSTDDVYKSRIASYYGWLIHCDATHLLKTIIGEMYYGFKKHSFKNSGVRTCVVGKRK